MTNRELYLAVVALADQQRASTRTLEDYLRALWRLAQPLRVQATLSASAFLGLLSEAFTAVPEPFDKSWRECSSGPEHNMRGFDGWAAMIVQQIADLRLMGENGTLKNQWRYFGVDAPLGGRWYNFDPCGFLECATEGTFGGWRPGDSTGRDFVPGKVAVLTKEGKLESRDPQEIEMPTYEISVVSWDTFRDFLLSGQIFE
jgi:hypothetical protein